MSKKHQVTYNKPDPPFLRKIREQIGYKAGPDIDTKREQLNRDDDLEDQDDEKPTVVITESSNLTKEEQEDFAEKLTEVKPAKILFKKPVKKDLQKEESQMDNKKNSSTKQSTLKRYFDDDKKDKSKKIKQNEKNIRLLSFDDEEEF